MSAHEWKPGDVALVRGKGVGPTVAIKGRTDAWVWIDATGRNPQGPGEACYMHESGAIEARPLVVIDPEDAEQVGRLMELIRPGAMGGLSKLTAALREFADPTPPKPPEPQGRYAVVEDADGNEWLRIDPAAVNWQLIGQPYADSRYSAWDRIPEPVTVLSEGVTPDA